MALVDTPVLYPHHLHRTAPEGNLKALSFVKAHIHDHFYCSNMFLCDYALHDV